MLVNPPLTEARTVDQPSTRLDQSLAYDLFLVIHVCGNRHDGQDRIEHGD